MRAPALAVLLAALLVFVFPSTSAAASSEEGNKPPTAVSSGAASTGWFDRVVDFFRSLASDESANPSDAGNDRQRADGRASLVAHAQPLWSDLNAEQRKALAPFEAEWNSWPLAEKRSWLNLADRLPGFSESRRDRVLRRIDEWSKLSPDARKQVRANYHRAKERPETERAQAWEDYQRMTPEQQEVLRASESLNNTGAVRTEEPNGLAREAQQPLPRVFPAHNLRNKPSAEPEAAPEAPRE